MLSKPLQSELNAYLYFPFLSKCWLPHQLELQSKTFTSRNTYKVVIEWTWGELIESYNLIEMNQTTLPTLIAYCWILDQICFIYSVYNYQVDKLSLTINGKFIYQLPNGKGRPVEKLG